MTDTDNNLPETIWAYINEVGITSGGWSTTPYRRGAKGQKLGAPSRPRIKYIRFDIVQALKDENERHENCLRNLRSLAESAGATGTMNTIDEALNPEESE